MESIVIFGSDALLTGLFMIGQTMEITARLDVFFENGKATSETKNTSDFSEQESVYK